MKITKDELVSSTLNGIIKAHKKYLEWSGNEWLSWAPEYLITVTVAEEISKIKKNKFITLEDNVGNILDAANAKGRGRISNELRANGRYDIVVWWAKGDPRAVVEVKHYVYKFAKLENDIKRVCKTLKRKENDSTLQYGLIAFYLDYEYKKGDAKNKMTNKINGFFDQAKEMVEEKGLKIEYYLDVTSDDDLSVFASVVFLIKK